MRRAPLLVLADPALISSGLAPDRHPVLQPLWEAAVNVRFYQGKVRRLLPAAVITSIGAPADPPVITIPGRVIDGGSPSSTYDETFDGGTP